MILSEERAEVGALKIVRRMMAQLMAELYLCREISSSDLTNCFAASCHTPNTVTKSYLQGFEISADEKRELEKVEHEATQRHFRYATSSRFVLELSGSVMRFLHRAEEAARGLTTPLLSCRPSASIVARMPGTGHSTTVIGS